MSFTSVLDARTSHGERFKGESEPVETKPCSAPPSRGPRRVRQRWARGPSPRSCYTCYTCCTTLTTTDGGGAMSWNHRRKGWQGGALLLGVQLIRCVGRVSHRSPTARRTRAVCGRSRRRRTVAPCIEEPRAEQA